MKKENFVSLVMGVVGGLLFALGMCMCLIAEWDSFTAGVVVTILGAVILIAMLLIRRKMKGKEPIKVTKKLVGTILLGLVGVAVFGLGMCLVMIWNHLVWGIIVGIVGIVILLCLIPLVKGLQ